MNHFLSQRPHDENLYSRLPLKKCWSLLAILLFVNQFARSQQEPIYILTDRIYDHNLISADSANALLNKKIRELFNELDLSNSFVPIVRDKKNVQPGDKFIKMYSSFNYLTAAEKEELIPKFIVHKRNWQTPYYYSYFIARKQPSRFNSFNDFGNIKRVYLQSNSMSGYYAPLYKFWELGFIKNPSVKSLESELKKEVFVYSTSDSVIDAVSKDDYSIGATGEEGFGTRNMEIKLVNMVLPQDVICISQSLIQYEEKMHHFIFKLFSNDNLIRNAHLTVTRVTPFTQPHLNSYTVNERIIKVVKATREEYDKDVYIGRIIPLNSKIEFQDILAFIGKSSLSVYIWIAGIFLAIYTLGFNTGHTVLPLLGKLKQAFEKGFKFKGNDS